MQVVRHFWTVCIDDAVAYRVNETKVKLHIVGEAADQEHPSFTKWRYHISAYH